MVTNATLNCDCCLCKWGSCLLRGDVHSLKPMVSKSGVSGKWNKDQWTSICSHRRQRMRLCWSEHLHLTGICYPDDELVLCWRPSWLMVFGPRNPITQHVSHYIRRFRLKYGRSVWPVDLGSVLSRRWLLVPVLSGRQVWRTIAIQGCVISASVPPDLSGLNYKSNEMRTDFTEPKLTVYVLPFEC